jgi:methionine aminopeptidase
VVRSYCGHGIHKLFHCAPNVPHYAKNKAVGVMKPGHCFTIEPMISEGVWGDQTWPDNWTSVTQVSVLHTRNHCCGSGLLIPDPNFSHTGSASKNLSILTQKMVSKLSEICSELFIPDPDFFHPGSASKNLSVLT